jgi:hypothetical protein
VKNLIVAVVLILGGSELSGAPAASQGDLLIGSWVLVSREDRTLDGRAIAEPNLGSDALGLLVYDRAGNVAAQLMRRSRSSGAGPATPPVQKDANNSGSADGYDAYFGTYTLNLESKSVTHHLVGALLPSDVGKLLTRHFDVSESELRLWFETAGASGQRIVRTLVFKRAGAP